MQRFIFLSSWATYFFFLILVPFSYAGLYTGTSELHDCQLLSTSFDGGFPAGTVEGTLYDGPNAGTIRRFDYFTEPREYMFYSGGDNYYRGRYSDYLVTSECFYPAPTEPDYCSDDEKSGDETGGVNCGGSCFSECDNYCPSGTKMVPVVGIPGAYSCVYESAADKNGNCLPRYSPAIMSDGSKSKTLCNKTVSLPYRMSPDFYDENFKLKTPDDLDIEPPSVWKNNDTSSWEDYGTETVIDNGDGTETATRISTYKNRMELLALG